MSPVVLMDVTTKVSKEMYELCKAPADITVSILEKAADGLTVDEIVSSLAGNVQGIIAAADGLKGLEEEVSEESGAFMRSSAIPISYVVDAAVKYNKAKKKAESEAPTE